MTFFVEVREYAGGYQDVAFYRPAEPMDVTDDMVERAAKVMWEQDQSEHDVSWEPNRETYRELAGEVLAAALTRIQEER